MQPRTKSQPCHDSRQGARVVCDLDQAHVKATLGARVTETLRTNDLTQIAAAELLGVDQPKISRLIRGQLGDFSTPRLLRFLVLLGQDIEIVVRTPAVQAQTGVGQLRVLTNNGTDS
jgi:predicted XRE-type DNA-binding protein